MCVRKGYQHWVVGPRGEHPVGAPSPPLTSPRLPSPRLAPILRLEAGSEAEPPPPIEAPALICTGHGARAGAQSSWLLQRPQGRGSTPQSACLALQARGVQSPMDIVGLGQEKHLERKRDCPG